MRVQIKRMTTKIAAALFLAAAIMSVGTKEARADEMDTQPAECVETVVEGQGDVIDDQFAVVEGQGDIIDDEFAIAPEAEEQPVVETVVDPFAGMILINSKEDLNRVMTEHRPFNPIKDGVIDPISLLPVKGQGDVIDDEFAYVEGQGDVIDDEFAYVEGQGDVIDDQFAVTPEAEATVEAVEVAENDTEVVAPSVNSFVAVGSVDCADSSEDERTAWKEQTIRDLDTKLAYDLNKIPEENKSHLTKALENFVNGFDLYKEDKKRVCDGIDSQDKFGVAEKEYLKELTKTGYSALNGFVTKELIPGIGPVKKAAQALESFSKANDAKGFGATAINVLEGIKNSAQTVIAIIPGGGGLINSAVDAGISTMKYVGIKLINWFS